MPPLTERERCQIAHDVGLGFSIQAIATGLGRSRRTIESELKANSGRHAYEPARAMAARRERAARTVQSHFETWLALSRDGQFDAGAPPACARRCQLQISRSHRKTLRCTNEGRVPSGEWPEIRSDVLSSDDAPEFPILHKTIREHHGSKRTRKMSWDS